MEVGIPSCNTIRWPDCQLAGVVAAIVAGIDKVELDRWFMADNLISHLHKFVFLPMGEQRKQHSARNRPDNSY